MRKDMISVEAAEAQLDIFAEYFDICEDDETEISGYLKTASNELITAIRKNRLEITDGDGNGLSVVQIFRKPVEGGPVSVKWNYNKIGLAKKSIPLGTPEKIANQYKKYYTFAGVMTGMDQSLIGKMDAIDLSLLEVISQLFLSI